MPNENTAVAEPETSVQENKEPEGRRCRTCDRWATPMVIVPKRVGLGLAPCTALGRTERLVDASGTKDYPYTRENQACDYWTKLTQ
jgi:hypothetical protein